MVSIVNLPTNTMDEKLHFIVSSFSTLDLQLQQIIYAFNLLHHLC